MNITPLYENELAQGATMKQYGSWMLPEFYSGTAQELEHAEQHTILFDRGDLDIYRLAAPGVTAQFDTRLVFPLRPGCRFNLIANLQGGTIEMPLIGMMAADDFLISTTPAGAKALHKDFVFDDLSEALHTFVLYGNEAEEILHELGNETLPAPGECGAIMLGEFKAVAFHLTGCGENGFTLFANTDHVEEIWDELLDFECVKPGGMALWEELRIRAGYPAVGKELTGEISLADAGFADFTKPSDRKFIGRPALERTLPRKKLAQLSGAVPEATSQAALPDAGGAHPALGYLPVKTPGASLNVKW